VPIYEYQCRECHSKFDSYSTLPHEIMIETCKRCGAHGDRLYSVCRTKIFQTFETTNILPDGEPVTVRSSSQLRQLEAEHRVKMADGPPPQTSFPEPS
jgi:putative FmdB family regulatory protein